MYIHHMSSVRQFANRMNDECLGVRITRLQRVVSRCYTDALRPLELTTAQLEILSVLAVVGAPIKPTALAAEMCVEKSTLSRNLALMTEHGWLATTPSPTGRAMAVELTADGTAMLASARAAWTKAQAALVATLGAGAIATLDGWLASL
jgi:DNA-binding MarR family transcriptional regulator